jgi:hypothetical protein
VDLLERIIAYVIANIGTTFPATSLAKYFKSKGKTVAPDIILNYIKFCSEETILREFGAYDRIRDNFPKYVVTLGEFDMGRNDIKHMNIRNFLLAEELN